MTIPFVDLKMQYKTLKHEIDPVVHSVMERGAFILGPELRQFEQDFGAYIGRKHCVGVSSGTAALELAMRACGLDQNDEVITVPNTFVATTEAITHAGAQLLWVEVDSRTYNLDVTRLDTAITSHTRALLPVHLYGQPADMAPIMDIARQKNLLVIEDCAQAHGATYRDQKVGTFGDVACFSFYPGKNLGAYGDGGAVLTDDDGIAERVRLLLNHGQAQKGIHSIEGFCHRLDNLQAAVLGVKLPHVDEWNAARRRAAAMYDQLLQDVPGVVTPYVASDVEHVYHLYVIQVPDRDPVRAALGEQDIQTGIHYPIPLHQQPAYAHLGHKPEDFPVSMALGPKILSLPMFPEIMPEQIEQVVAALRKALQGP